MSDQLLVQLQLFPIRPAAAKIPDTIAKGSPLFYMPPNSNIPVSIYLDIDTFDKTTYRIMFIKIFWLSLISHDVRSIIEMLSFVMGPLNDRPMRGNYFWNPTEKVEVAQLYH